MYLPDAGLNYPHLLQLADNEALSQAVFTVQAFDLKQAMTLMGLAYGAPLVRTDCDPLATRVFFEPILFSPVPPSDFIDYRRLDLGQYMACCQRYLVNTTEPTPEAIAAWLLSEHGLFFDPADLSVVVGSLDPTDPLATQWTVTVASDNYVWTGAVVLLAVVGNHIALYARPGTARGLTLEDVGIIRS